MLKSAVAGERFRDILNYSLNSRGEDTTRFTRRLTEIEKKLFMAGSASAKDYHAWKSRRTEAIRASSILTGSVVS